MWSVAEPVFFLDLTAEMGDQMRACSRNNRIRVRPQAITKKTSAIPGEKCRIQTEGILGTLAVKLAVV